MQHQLQLLHNQISSATRSEISQESMSEKIQEKLSNKLDQHNEATCT
jgi:hypothetical protein